MDAERSCSFVIKVTAARARERQIFIIESTLFVDLLYCATLVCGLKQTFTRVASFWDATRFTRFLFFQPHTNRLASILFSPSLYNKHGIGIIWYKIVLSYIQSCSKIAWIIWTILNSLYYRIGSWNKLKPCRFKNLHDNLGRIVCVMRFLIWQSQ